MRLISTSFLISLLCACGEASPEPESVELQTSLPCGNGTKIIDGKCVVDLKCGTNTQEVNGECVVQEIDGIACGQGTVLDGNFCVALDVEGLSCGAGTQQDGNFCVPSAELGCAVGTQRNGNTCVPNYAALCGDNTVEDEGVCIGTGKAAPRAWNDWLAADTESNAATVYSDGFFAMVSDMGADQIRNLFETPSYRPVGQHLALRLAGYLRPLGDNWDGYMFSNRTVAIDPREDLNCASWSGDIGWNRSIAVLGEWSEGDFTPTACAIAGSLTLHTNEVTGDLEVSALVEFDDGTVLENVDLVFETN